MLWSFMGCFGDVDWGKGWKTVGGMCRASLIVLVLGIFVGLMGEFEHVFHRYGGGCLYRRLHFTDVSSFGSISKGSLAECAFLHMFSWSRSRTWMARIAKSSCFQKKLPVSCSCSQSLYYLSTGSVELMALRHTLVLSYTAKTSRTHPLYPKPSKAGNQSSTPPFPQFLPKPRPRHQPPA